ncbi:hypothetical protein AWE51_20685 [Aquimarina aggregata]|uniref:YhhN-like protein n=1 Tax=Aquimarina aggregata TaxID=1642818 RepID=A0A163BV10_9FLAO|nr:hypothetical protein AWE51_20685 [Aquimarina aggregata]
MCSAIFLDKSSLIYTKPFVQIALIVLYLTEVKRINFLFPIMMLAVLVLDVFIYIDFVKYLNLITALVLVYYLGGVLMLKQYISKEDIKVSKLVSLPVLVSVAFVSYLIYAIAELALPRAKDSIGAILLIATGALVFSMANFIVYMVDRYEKSIYLFVTACCTLFIDGLLAINEMYYYAKVFTILINLVEITGLYFLTSFFIETKLIETKSSKGKYF